MQRAFVTGGSGFVGRSLLETLRATSVPTIALARSDAAAAACAGRGARVVRGDLDALEDMTAAMAGCDVVFHCAAHVGEWDAPAVFERVNVTGTANVLAAAIRAGVTRLVHVSTEAVLVGGPPIVRVDETRPLPDHPPAMYPASKGAAERLLRAANDRMDVVIVRPRFIWGVGDTSVLPLLMAAVRDGRFRWISGGRYKTSTCHVNNVVEGMLLAAERGRRGETYFLTDGEPLEFRAFVGEMLTLHGLNPGDGTLPHGVAAAIASVGEAVARVRGYRWKPPLTRVGLKLMGEEVTVVDRKARTELGYVARTSPEEGLAEMRRSLKNTVQL